MKNLFGSTISLAALHDIEAEALPDFFHQTAGEFVTRAVKEPERTERQLQDAKDRYVFVRPDRAA